MRILQLLLILLATGGIATPVAAVETLGARHVEGLSRLADPGRALPPPVLREMGEMVDIGLMLFVKEFQKSGKVLPQGIIRTASGTTQGIVWSGDNPPPATEMFKNIHQSMRSAARNQEVVAAVIVMTTSVPTKDRTASVDGVRVEVDHRNGRSSIVFIPYVYASGKLQLGRMIYLRGETPIFDHGAPYTGAVR